MSILIATKSSKKMRHLHCIQLHLENSIISGNVYSQLWSSRPISNIRSISNIYSAIVTIPQLKSTLVLYQALLGNPSHTLTPNRKQIVIMK